LWMDARTLAWLNTLKASPTRQKRCTAESHLRMADGEHHDRWDRAPEIAQAAAGGCSEARGAETGDRPGRAAHASRQRDGGAARWKPDARSLHRRSRRSQSLPRRHGGSSECPQQARGVARGVTGLARGGRRTEPERTPLFGAGGFPGPGADASREGSSTPGLQRGSRNSSNGDSGTQSQSKRGLPSRGRFPGTSLRARRADALPRKRRQNGTRSHQRRPQANKAPVREGIRRDSWVT
jgi:hypothetical protein